MFKHYLVIMPVVSTVCTLAAATGSESPAYRPLLKHCAKINNSELCAQAIEKSYGGRSESRLFRRLGATLEVITPRRTFRLRNNENPDGDVSYHYLAYLAQHGIHVVHMQYSEGNDFAVIGDQDDERHVVSGFPITSPDGRRFFSYNVAGETQFTPDAFEVWRIEGGVLKKEFSTSPEFASCQIHTARWVSNNAISLVGKPIEEPLTKVNCRFRFSLVAGRWLEQ